MQAGGRYRLALDGGPYFFIQTPTKVLIIQQGEQIAADLSERSALGEPETVWFGESIDTRGRHAGRRHDR
jgi:hypothetical protein